MPREIWRRLRAWFARVLRREAAPGRYESGSVSSTHGRLLVAPMVEATRDFLVYVPRGWTRWRRAQLVVLCHGCRQSPEDFAGTTRVAEIADRLGWLVLLPRQSKAANAWGCWNWFDPNTTRGDGEAAIIASQIVAVRRRYRTARQRVWVAGLSAGGAVAAVLGLRHPRLVRGVVVHSGLACGAASSAATALSVMRHGPDNDVTRVADDARVALRDNGTAVALLAIQGDADDVVAPANAIALVRQYLRFNGHVAGSEAYDRDAPLPAGDGSVDPPTGGQGAPRVRDWLRDGRVVVRHVGIAGLGHAWSGGDPQFGYADADAPDALELFAAFASEAAG